jgi:hypothetical protein
MRIFLTFLTIAFQFRAQAQSSTQCFTDFDFYKNEGVSKLDNCNAGYMIKCFSKGSKIYKFLASSVYGDEHDYIKSYDNELIKVKSRDSGIMYIFPMGKMPLEGGFIRTAMDNRFDTLLCKNDTLYFKKAFPRSLQLSKYFYLSKDTICVVSFFYNLQQKPAERLDFENINHWGSDKEYHDYQIIKMVMSNALYRFVSKIDSEESEKAVTTGYLNDIVRTSKVPPSLFWMCMVFRFMI